MTESSKHIVNHSFDGKIFPGGSVVSRESTTDEKGVDFSRKDHDSIGTRNAAIMQLSEHDVMLGRGTGSNEHTGNIRFRAMVRQALESTDLDKLDGKRKAAIAKEILDVIKSNNGRFVKTISAGGRRTFAAVTDEVALDKIKQSFRHQLRVLGVPMASKSDVDYVNHSTTIASAHSNVGGLAENGVSTDATMALERLWDVLKNSIPIQISAQLLNQGDGTATVGPEVRPSLPTDALLREIYYAHLCSTGTRTTSMGFSNNDGTCQGVSATPASDPLGLALKTLLSMKANDVIRQITSSALQISSVAPPPLASIMQTNPTWLPQQTVPASSWTLSSCPSPDLGLLESRLALARALSMSSPPLGTQNFLGSVSIVDALLNNGKI